VGGRGKGGRDFFSALTRRVPSRARGGRKRWKRREKRELVNLAFSHSRIGSEKKKRGGKAKKERERGGKKNCSRLSGSRAWPESKRKGKEKKEEGRHSESLSLDGLRRIEEKGKEKRRRGKGHWQIYLRSIACTSGKKSKGSPWRR